MILKKTVIPALPFFKISLWILFVFPLLWACEPKEEIVSTDPNARLSFSVDTVHFDTVFTTVGSITKRLKVYNESENAVDISRISIARESTPFSLIINGVEAQSVENLRLLGKDSLLVLTKVFIDPRDEDLPFIEQDSLLVEWNGNRSDVKLIAWGQDAIFFRSGLQAVACDVTWTKDRPYVIYDSLLIRENCTLTIEAGTRVHFASNAALFVGGTLLVAGSCEDSVTFQSTRLDDGFEEQYGLWDAIYFLPNSRGNIIDHAVIKNANTGFYLGTPDDDAEPDLIIQNSRIQNMALFGIQCITSDLLLSNTLISNCVVNTLRCTAGGNYRIVNSTLASLSNNFFREDPSFAITTFLELGDGTVLRDDVNLQIVNSIIWGRLEEEMILLADDQSTFSIAASTNIFRTNIQQLADGNTLNIAPIFIDPLLGDFNLLLPEDNENPAINKGLFIPEITTDLNCNPRDEQPDIGAFEYIEE